MSKEERRRIEAERAGKKIQDLHAALERVELSYEVFNEYRKSLKNVASFEVKDARSLTISCPDPECTKSFFDLDDAISETIRSGEQTHEGELYCDGWQDEERRGKHKCGNKVAFRVALTRKPGSS